MKKVFNVHFATSESEKTDVVYYVAEDIAQVISAIPVEIVFQVVGVSVGPSVEVL